MNFESIARPSSGEAIILRAYSGELDDDTPAANANTPQSRKAPLPDGVTLEDFVSLMTTGAYIFTATGDQWPAKSVNARIPAQPVLDADGKQMLESGKPVMVKASTWLDKNKPVEQLTWAPGEPEIIEGKILKEGGWIPRPGCRGFNLYRPPLIERGYPNEAKPWLEHIQRVYGDDAAHIVRWFAQRVQKPQEKINHALVLGGAQGIGKDTMLEPVKRAVGPWNFQEVSPAMVVGRFNSHVRSVIMRVSEARDLGDVDRYSLYEHMKTAIAAPPGRAARR
jgi:hypothetical protein